MSCEVRSPAGSGPVNRSNHTKTINIPQKRPFHKESMSMVLATLGLPSGRKEHS